MHQARHRHRTRLFRRFIFPDTIWYPGIISKSYLDLIRSGEIKYGKSESKNRDSVVEWSISDDSSRSISTHGHFRNVFAIGYGNAKLSETCRII